MSAGIWLVIGTVVAILTIALISEDENNSMNYYVCERCNNIIAHRFNRKHVTCQSCGEMLRRIKKR